MSAELRSSAVKGIGENSFAHRRFSYVTKPFIPRPASQFRSVLTFVTALTFISRTWFVMFPFSMSAAPVVVASVSSYATLPLGQADNCESYFLRILLPTVRTAFWPLPW